MKSSLVVVLALCACGGKSEPKGDCGKAVDNAMTLSKEEYKTSGVTEETLPKIRAASVQRCTEDKWPNTMLVCLEKAKSTDDVIKCQKQLKTDQQNNMAKAITAVITAAEKPVAPEAGSGSGSGSAEAGSAAPTPAGMPAECAEYKAIIEKLAACDKLPAASRELLQKTFDDSAKNWANFDKLPENSRAALVQGCKQGTDAVKQAAGATCGL